MKRILLVILTSLLIFSTAGCSLHDTNADKNGNILIYEKDTLPDSGYFIKSGDSFFPLMPNGVTLDGEEFMYNGTTLNPTRFAWLANKDYLIPVLDLDQGDQLIYRSDEFDINSVIKIEKFEDRGYTIGVGFKEMDNSGFYHFDKDMICEGSSAEQVLKNVSDMKAITVVGINEQNLTSNMFDGSGTLINLQQNDVYEFNVYKGTNYIEVEMTADAHLYFSSGILLLDNYSLTREGYVVIKIPETVPEGKYYIEGKGMFQITGHKESQKL